MTATAVRNFGGIVLKRVRSASVTVGSKVVVTQIISSVSPVVVGTADAAYAAGSAATAASADAARTFLENAGPWISSGVSYAVEKGSTTLNAAAECILNNTHVAGTILEKVENAGPLMNSGIAYAVEIGGPAINVAAECIVENADTMLGIASCVAGDVSPAVVYSAQFVYSIVKDNFSEVP